MAAALFGVALAVRLVVLGASYVVPRALAVRDYAPAGFARPCVSP